MFCINIDTFHEWSSTFVRPKVVLAVMILWNDMSPSDDVTTLIGLACYTFLELATLVIEDRVAKDLLYHETDETKARPLALRIDSASGFILAIDFLLFYIIFTLNVGYPGRILLFLEGTSAIIGALSPMAKGFSGIIFARSNDISKLVDSDYYVDYIVYLYTWAITLAQYSYLTIHQSHFHFSLPSTVLLLGQRFAFKKLSSRIKSHRNFIKAITIVQEKFPLDDVTDTELDRVCAICRTRVEKGSKLPCKHCYHVKCLFSWLRTCAECPTCRRKINFDPGLCIVDADERDRLREHGVVGGFANPHGNIGFGTDTW